MAPTALLDRLPASALLPGADGACLACGGAGWVVSGVVLKPIVCTCVATCPACGGSGYVAGGAGGVRLPGGA